MGHIQGHLSHPDVIGGEVGIETTTGNEQNPAQIQESNSKRNELSPLMQLPNELICRITIEYRDLHKASHPSMSWTNVTHVCRRWRIAALGYPELWSYISDTPVSWTRVFLERSMPIPIAFTLKRYQPPFDAGLAICHALRQTARLQSLTIAPPYTGSKDFIMRWLNHLSSTAPRLRALCLTYTTHFHNESLQIPQKFVDNLSQNLHTLQLTNCDIPWKAPLFQSLINFQFSFTGDLPMQPEHFLGSLDKMRNVVHLNLSMSFPDMDVPSLDGRSVHLPHVATLHLQSTLKKCLGVLKHITLPSSATVHLRCTESSNPTAIENLGSAFSSHFPRHLPTDQPLIKSLRITSNCSLNAHPIHVGLWPQVMHFHYEDTVPDPSTSLTLIPTWNWQGATPAPDQILYSLPFSNVSVLYLRHVFRFISNMTSVFDCLPSLESIFLDANTVTQFIGCLKRDHALSQPDVANGPSRPTIRLASLKSIFFHPTYFCSNSCRYNDEDRAPVSFTNLVEMLTLRARFDVRILKVVFKECWNLRREGIEAIEALGTEVEWDQDSALLTRELCHNPDCLVCLKDKVMGQVPNETTP